MGQRTQPRSQRVLTVRVLGMDVNGRPILQTLRTVNISRQRCGDRGSPFQRKPGEVVSLQYKDRKVRYRVVWTGETGSERAGQLGLEQLNLKMICGKWICRHRRRRSSDKQKRGAERRQQRRFEAFLPVEVRSQASGSPIRAETSDISLSGCYVNTLFPAPIDTVVTHRDLAARPEAGHQGQGPYQCSRGRLRHRIRRFVRGGPQNNWRPVHRNHWATPIGENDANGSRRQKPDRN